MFVYVCVSGSLYIIILFNKFMIVTHYSQEPKLNLDVMFSILEGTGIYYMFLYISFFM